MNAVQINISRIIFIFFEFSHRLRLPSCTRFASFRSFHHHFQEDHFVTYFSLKFTLSRFKPIQKHSLTAVPGLVRFPPSCLCLAFEAFLCFSYSSAYLLHQGVVYSIFHIFHFFHYFNFFTLSTFYLCFSSSSLLFFE